MGMMPERLTTVLHGIAQLSGTHAGEIANFASDSPMRGQKRCALPMMTMVRLTQPYSPDRPLCGFGTISKVPGPTFQKGLAACAAANERLQCRRWSPFPTFWNFEHAPRL